MGIAIDFQGNFMLAEVFNSITHGVGFLVALVALIYMFVRYGSADGDRSTGKLVSMHSGFGQASIGIYSISLCFMFLMSCIYHSLFYFSKASNVMQILDHTSIYCLIAGTYTPILVLACNGYRSSYKYIDGSQQEVLSNGGDAGASIIFSIYWTIAFLGIFLYWKYGDRETTKKYIEGNTAPMEIIELVLYAVMGLGGAWYIFVPGSCSTFVQDNMLLWTIKHNKAIIPTSAEAANDFLKDLVVYDSNVTQWCRAIWLPIAIGGACYLGGIYFFVSGQTRPVRHVIWHIMVMLGAGFHYFAVYNIVRVADMGGFENKLPQHATFETWKKFPLNSPTS